jgi:hypothetical protein
MSPPVPRRFPSDAVLEDVRLEELEDGWTKLPPATRRCFDCGVGSGPCVCTREFGLWEAEQEELEA